MVGAAVYRYVWDNFKLINLSFFLPFELRSKVLNLFLIPFIPLPNCDETSTSGSAWWLVDTSSRTR